MPEAVPFPNALLRKSHQSSSLAGPSWATMVAFGSQVGPTLYKDKINT